MLLREFFDKGTAPLNELNVAQTLDFIKQAHGDQLYGKLPYWTHPRAVALTGKKIFGGKFNSNAVKVAFLHDVVEDTNVGLDELSKLGFDPVVIEAVSLLTKDKTLGYSQNIERIINSGNPLAMMVKYADNYENFTGDKSDWDPKRASSSQKKYLMSLNMLGDKLGVAHHIDEARRKKKRTRQAAYGPGPYGWYGFDPGYSGDGGGGDGGVEEGELIPFPKGTVKVDVSDVYDWYKLGQHVSDLKRLGKHDFGKGPPQTVMAFGSEPLEHEYLKYLKRLGLTTHDIDENFANGRNPQDKGDAKRHGINTKASVSSLRKTAKQGGRKGQLAHWLANMKAGRKKANESRESGFDFKIFEDFFPIAMKVLGITKLPKIKLVMQVDDPDQPTFGRFDNSNLTIELGMANRHPIDILRTLAHELTHFKQYLNNQLGPDSGETGSPEENEAHEVAGVIMRHFNKMHRHYFHSRPLEP